jgi:hypothetical protein
MSPTDRQLECDFVSEVFKFSRRMQEPTGVQEVECEDFAVVQ